MPKCEPADVFQKIVPFSLPSKFVDEITEDDKIKTPHYKLSDTKIKQFVNKQEVCKAFIWILIDAYKPTKVKLMNDQQTFIDTFKIDHEFDFFHEVFYIINFKNIFFNGFTRGDPWVSPLMKQNFNRTDFFEVFYSVRT